MHYENRIGIKKEGLSGGKWNEHFSFLHLCPKQMHTKLSDISALKLKNIFLPSTQMLFLCKTAVKISKFFRYSLIWTSCDRWVVNHSTSTQCYLPEVPGIF